MFLAFLLVVLCEATWNQSASDMMHLVESLRIQKSLGPGLPITSTVLLLIAAYNGLFVSQYNVLNLLI